MSQEASPSPADVASVRFSPRIAEPDARGLARPGHVSTARWTLWTVSLAERKPVPKNWSGRRGSNPRPTAWEAVTLPLSYSRLPDRTQYYLRGGCRCQASLTSVGSQPSPGLRRTLVVPDSLRKYVIKSADQYVCTSWLWTIPWTHAQQCLHASRFCSSKLGGDIRNEDDFRWQLM